MAENAGSKPRALARGVLSALEEHRSVRKMDGGNTPKRRTFSGRRKGWIGNGMML
jgi:hypothetical protein